LKNHKQQTFFSEEKLHRIECGKTVENKSQFKVKHGKEFYTTERLGELEEFKVLCGWVENMGG